MIENQDLTVKWKENPLLFWRPESENVTNILLALLLTILSYQTTAIIVDLVFGLKPSGVAETSNVMLSQLMHRSSLTPLHRQFRPAKGMMNPLQSSTYCHPIRFKLFFVLLLAPLINIGSILLTLPKNSTLTFSEAGLGALAFGIHPRTNAEELSFKNVTSFCKKANTNFGKHSSSLVDFIHCCEVGRNDFTENDTATIRIQTNRDDESGKLIPGLIAQIAAPGRALYITSRLQISGSHGLSLQGKDHKFIVENRFQQNEIDMLVEDVIDMYKNLCASNDAAKDMNRTDRPSIYLEGAKSVRCELSNEEGKSFDGLDQVAKMICSRASFINDDDDRTNVITADSSEPVILDDVPLVRSRRSITSPIILLILMLIAVVIRAAVKNFSRNDISDGLGLVVREALQLPCCDSMLCRNDVVFRYGDDEQN